MKELAKIAVKRLEEAGFEQAEARVTASQLTEMQIDAGEVSLMRTTNNTGLNLRGVMDGRYASLRINQLAEDAVRNAVMQLKEAAQVAPQDSARQLADGGGAKSFSHGPMQPDREQMLARIESFCMKVAKELPLLKMEQAGLSHSQVQSWVINNRGLDIQESHGSYNFGAMFAGKRGEKASSFNFFGAQRNDLREDLINWGMGQELMESSVREIDHRPFQGKFTGQVVLSPMVFHGFLSEMLGHLSDGSLISKTSVLRDKMNQKVFCDRLTVRISPTDPELANHEFTTGDGYLSEPSIVVDQGQLKSWMLSDYGSRKTGLPRALNDGGQVVVEPGNETRAALNAKVEKGIYISRFSGGRPAANGDFSGTAKNSYLIENGKLTQPLSEVMISGNVFEILKNLNGLSQERLNDGSSLIPWALVDGITVSGG